MLALSCPHPRQFLAASRRILPFLRSRFRARFFGCRSIPASPSESPLRLSAPLPLGRPGIRSGSDSTVLRLHSCFSSTLASLPRKEVIQPHLPIRLPCYDFTPVIGLTFDGCPLSVSSCSQLPWCDGRCVQGPGTYSPRHADPRLLATPTSCGRVAAHSPN